MRRGARRRARGSYCDKNELAESLKPIKNDLTQEISIVVILPLLPAAVEDGNLKRR